MSQKVVYLCVAIQKLTLHHEAFKDMMETESYYIHSIGGERIEQSRRSKETI